MNIPNQEVNRMPRVLVEEETTVSLSPMQSTTYAQIVELNEQGVQRLQSSSFDEAIPLFGKALSYLLDRSRADDPAFGQEGGVAPKKEEGACSLWIETVPVPEPVSSASLPDEIFGFFGKALTPASQSPIITGNDNPCRNHLLSIIVTYNVAITYHLIGLQNGGKSSTLTKSLDFYSMAYMSATDGTRDVGIDCATLDLCLMALANQIGHIHASFHRFQDAAICSDEIARRLSSLCGLISVYERHPPVSVLSEEYRTFFLNACFFCECVLIAASAA
jgi:hypothetical protein